jgi:hypothetical protein
MPPLSRQASSCHVFLTCCDLLAADSWDYGAWLLTHEVGHYLGLRHPGSTSCSSPHGESAGAAGIARTRAPLAAIRQQ